MTAEKKNEVYRELIEWTKNPADVEAVLKGNVYAAYLEERVYAVRMAEGCVALVMARSPHDAVNMVDDSSDEFRNAWHGEEDKYSATGGGCGCVDRKEQAMTRAEAIKIIEGAKTEAEWEKSLEYQIAFDMAIEAMKINNYQTLKEIEEKRCLYLSGGLVPVEAKCERCGEGQLFRDTNVSVSTYPPTYFYYCSKCGNNESSTLCLGIAKTEAEQVLKGEHNA